MAYAALVLAVLGLSAGLLSRLKVLLLLVLAVFLLSIGYSLRGGFSFLETAAIVVIAQAILQICYLLGVAIHTMLSPSEVLQSNGEADSMDSAGKVSASALGRPRKTRGLLRPFAQRIVRSELPSRQR